MKQKDVVFFGKKNVNVLISCASVLLCSYQWIALQFLPQKSSNPPRPARRIMPARTFVQMLQPVLNFLQAGNLTSFFCLGVDKDVYICKNDLY